MSAKADAADPALLTHGSELLPSVMVDAYNAELRSANGFLGDRASKGAFRAILDDWRERVSKMGEDPIGEHSSDEIGKKQMEKILLEGDPEAAGIIQGVIEDFAHDFVVVIRRFLRLKAWKDTERIVIGGGLRQGRIGELVIGRTAVLLKAEGIDTELHPIRHDSDHAGLLGCAHLVPSWMLSGHDSVLAVDIGGTNIRAGIVRLHNRKQPDLSQAEVTALLLWKHGDESPSRDDAVQQLNELLLDLIKQARKERLSLAPFVGIGCPGVIRADGSIDRGAQNLPGNWETKSFNLPRLVREAIPRIGEHETVVLLHNDAVVQGLSQLPFMQDITHWGVMTMGTGLGNAHFTNRHCK